MSALPRPDPPTGAGAPAGFRPELLGESFGPDEMGRIQKMTVERQEMAENGPGVFRSAIEALRELHRQKEAQKGDLSAQLAYLREKKAKLHKRKADDT